MGSSEKSLPFALNLELVVLMVIHNLCRGEGKLMINL